MAEALTRVLPMGTKQGAGFNYDAELAQLKQRDAYRQLRQIDQRGKLALVEGAELINLSSNDYLGLASREDIKQQFFEQHPPDTLLLGSSSSRLLTGNFAAHQALEASLNDAFGRHSLLFNSGYHMNLGILPALSNERMLIVSDQLIHASMIDGIRLTKAKRQRFAHQDLEQLELLLHQAQRDSSIDQVIVVVESLYSMDGDITDLARLVALKRRYNKTLLYVDEAHAIGVVGKNGLGVAEQAGCIADIDFLLGTFGKALASMGGYLICSESVRELLINRARSLIFSTAQPPINALWSRFTFTLMQQMAAERQRLTEISNRIKSTVVSKGFTCPSHSHIVPVIYGSNQRALAQAKQLQAQGFYALPIRPPTVPEASSRVRLCLRADLSWDDLAPLLAVL